MHTQLARRFRPTAWAAIGLLSLNVSFAAEAPRDFQIVDGVAIYLGVVPAQIIQGHPKEHEERRMHGGVPASRYRHHLMVAPFDAASGRRIEDAQVTAAVTELGLASKRKTLEPMRIDDTVSYGNYFDIRSNGTYRIEVEIRRPGHAGPIKATFNHRHFAP
ncbi:conserved hypothetical protein [Thiobacillus denitrificans ATCC 25259]|uniref:DUF4426 domain-containing protein n=1 Tax=Thiobacillus denitrificans (strain ATCC 25259 / T1) TaxID=292415 RepID=Q3SJ91_THIDA|nr:hypothetical protein [Thiobacillus denitrificans]AAZ97276.1 conserved hypothetical protein [Thiobacillus denitrificans ATCC 25259]